MRRHFITIALFAVLGTLAVSCQKENIIDQTPIVAENGNIYKVRYSIDGITFHRTFVGDEAWHDFLNWMIALAEEGHRVSFRNEDSVSQSASTKDVVVFTTTSSTEAEKWANNMLNQGYEVSIEFDRETGKYTCTAIK